MTVTGKCIFDIWKHLNINDTMLFLQVKNLLRGERSTVRASSPISARVYRPPRIQGLFIGQMWGSEWPRGWWWASFWCTRGFILFGYFAVINGEKATLETPTFAQKRQRTLDMLIRSLYQDLMPDLHKVRLLFVRPLQTPAAVRSWENSLPVKPPLSPHTGKSHGCCCTAFFHRSPQFASAYCTMTGYYCNADFLRNPPPRITFVLFLFFFLTLVPLPLLPLLFLRQCRSYCCNPSARVNL